MIRWIVWQATGKTQAPRRRIIEYTDPVGNVRYYEPDWVIVLSDGTHDLAETKGREDVDVARQDRAAQIWCENATLLTDVEWRYTKLPENDFGKLQPTDFAHLQSWSLRNPYDSLHCYQQVRGPYEAIRSSKRAATFPLGRFRKGA